MNNIIKYKKIHLSKCVEFHYVEHVPTNWRHIAERRNVLQKKLRLKSAEERSSISNGAWIKYELPGDEREAVGISFTSFSQPYIKSPTCAKLKSRPIWITLFCFTLECLHTPLLLFMLFFRSKFTISPPYRYQLINIFVYVIHCSRLYILVELLNDLGSPFVSFLLYLYVAAC